MCLTKITKRADKKDEKEYIGYKCFDVVGDGFEFPFYNYSPRFAIGVKMKANRVIVYTNGKRYTSGFHIFKSAAVAKKYRTGSAVFKVKYSGNVTQGLHSVKGSRLYRCDVAKYMTILERVA